MSEVKHRTLSVNDEEAGAGKALLKEYVHVYVLCVHRDMYIDVCIHVAR